MHRKREMTAIQRLYRVALLGNQENSPGGYYSNSFQCTLKLFDITADALCFILERVDLEGLNHEDAGVKVMMSYQLQGGGRMFPPVSREAVANAMQGVDILIAVVSTFQLNWVYWEIFECMIEDNLMESCTVILKLLDDQIMGGRRRCITADNALQNSGFVGDKWKGNASILADTKLGGKGVQKGINEIRARLLAREFADGISRPVEEIFSSSKSAVKSGGNIISRWIRKLLKSY